VSQTNITGADEGNHLTKNTQLENRIKTATKNLTRDHNKTLRTVSSLKKKINDLELNISRRDNTSADADAKKLNITMEKLDAFVDSVILKSANVAREYERLKLKCAKQAFEPPELKDLLTQCRKNEQLAKDLLCYSLAHLKKEQAKNE
jgi:hypothetical protein